MKAHASLLGLRAGLALALLLGFYALALALIAVIFGAVAGLVILVVAQDRVPPAGFAFVVVALLGGAFSLARGMLSGARRGENGPPLGIETSPATQPVLWAEARNLASTLGAPAPDRIHLVPGVTAFVSQESRLLGLVKGEVVLGVGLGLLSVLNEAELRAVLAHEFGHITGGDTRLGPLVHRAQRKIQQTVHVLEEDGRLVKALIARPFRLYFLLFRRTTMAVSRAQERAADRAAVRVAGGPAAIRALERTGIADSAFDHFVERYVTPLWRCGRWPEEMYAGFRALCTEPARQDELVRVREAVLAEETGRWDSHPSIGERVRLIAALADPASALGDLASAPPSVPASASASALGGSAAAPPSVPVPPSAPAWRLVADPERTEREMALIVARAATGSATLRPVGWDAAAAEILGPGLAAAGDALRSRAVAVGAQWDRGGLDQALELVATGRAHDLARALAPDADDPDAALRNAFRMALAAEIVERHGGRWTASWSAPAGVAWDGTPVDELAARVLSGDIASVRDELDIPGGPFRDLGPLHAEAAAHA